MIGGVTLLCGPPGTFKTSLCLFIAAVITMGTGMLFSSSYEGSPCFALWVDFERKDDVTMDKIKKFGLTDKTKRVFGFPEEGHSVDVELSSAFFDDLSDYLGNCEGQCKLVVMDGLNCGLPRGVSENCEDGVRYILKQLADVAQKHEISILLTHHTRKGGKSPLCLRMLNTSTKLLTPVDCSISQMGVHAGQVWKMSEAAASLPVECPQY